MKDLLYAKCPKCKKGRFAETSFSDEIKGTLHCEKCGNFISRWKKGKKDRKMSFD